MIFNAPWLELVPKLGLSHLSVRSKIYTKSLVNVQKNQIMKMDEKLQQKLRIKNISKTLNKILNFLKLYQNLSLSQP